MVVVEPRKIKSVSIFSPSICHEVMGPDPMILVFWVLSFKPSFPLSSFLFIKRLIPLHFMPLGWYHLHIWGCCYFSGESWFQLAATHHQVLAIWCPRYLYIYAFLHPDLYPKWPLPLGSSYPPNWSFIRAFCTISLVSWNTILPLRPPC